MVIERASEVITDVAFVHHPTLGLLERMKKYADMNWHSEEQMAWPQPIPAWESIINKDGNCEIPEPERIRPR